LRAFRHLAFGRYEEVERDMGKRKPRVQQAEIVQRFGARLRELRQARDTTQADLARAAQVALSHLSKLEKGEAAPGLDLLDRLAKALGTTVADLLPQSVAVENVDDQRGQIRKAFESVLLKAGGETLRLLELFLARLAESPSSKR
jgi:transcriptional regulator with XRE-family HTH domain